METKKPETNVGGAVGLGAVGHGPGHIETKAAPGAPATSLGVHDTKVHADNGLQVKDGTVKVEKSGNTHKGDKMDLSAGNLHVESKSATAIAHVGADKPAVSSGENIAAKRDVKHLANDYEKAKEDLGKVVKEFERMGKDIAHLAKDEGVALAPAGATPTTTVLADPKPVIAHSANHHALSGGLSA